MTDLISREDAEMVFRNARQDLFKHREQYSPEEFNTRDLMLLNAEQFIHLLPSVKQEPKTGHWIITCKSNITGFSIKTCSICNTQALEISKYCPNCGCRMESEESE